MTPWDRDYGTRDMGHPHAVFVRPASRNMTPERPIGARSDARLCDSILNTSVPPVPVILSAVALLAVWLPALRASKLNPMEALRTE